MQCCGHRACKGTTLGEVLVSVAFLAIVAAAIVSAVVRSGRGAATAELRSVALSSAKSAIADAKAKAFQDELAVGNSSKAFALPAGNTSGMVSTAVKKTLGYSNLYTVQVTASFVDADTAQSVSLETLLRSGS